MKAYCRECIDPYFLDLGTSQLHVQAALPQGKEPPVLIGKEVG
jgi:hypothetical protein